MLNRFACFWPKGYQRGSPGKIHQRRLINKSIMMFLIRLQARVFDVTGRFACFWPKGYQRGSQAREERLPRGSLGKSHKNGDYLKQAMRKNCLPTETNTGFEPGFWPANVNKIIIDLSLTS